ncbi:MAG: ABC transporter permease [Syntrophaceae bacterium]|nr:ABC transporter permease [Syntrophaceae bacterium]
MKILSKIRHAYSQRNLIRQLVVREVKGRYAGSSIGIYWSVINPLIMLAVYTYVFSVILRVRLGDEPGITNFALYLFCGFLAWNGFQEMVQRSTTVVLDNALLIKNLSFPSKALLVSIGINSIINEMIGIGILTVAVKIILGFFPKYIWFLIPLLFLELLFGLGLGFIFSTLHVFFRDTAQFVGVLMLIWMFGTPLFYPESMIPAQFKFLLDLNPMAYLVRMFREICLRNQFPLLNDVILFFIISIIVFMVGYSIYTKRFYRFIDQL